MRISRRGFMRSAVAASTLGVAGKRALMPVAEGATVEAFHPELLPSQKEVWEWQTWMAKLGPKYTGNRAHVEFVDFLATDLKEYGYEVQREHYTFPRWEARRTQLSIKPASGDSFQAPVTSYFPYSGQTPAQGVTGELVYAGHSPNFDLNGLEGKIALVDFATSVRKFGQMYEPWGTYPADAHFPAEYRPARGAVNDLTKFAKAGAIGVVLAWTDISDANAADQYTPFSRPPQGVPGLYVGRDTGAKLKALASSGAKATLVLEAATIEESPTDTLLTSLPGDLSDEIIVVNTHTDGPNATEENGGLGILALAKYFSQIPEKQRKRTILFALTTGHFAGPWVPSMRGVLKKYSYLSEKAVAALTIEHLGCKEWADDASLHYRPTGENEWAVAITESEPLGNRLVDTLQGSGDQRTAVVNPVHGGWLGEGAGLAHAGIPTIGYIPQPNYLLAGPQDGCIDKLSPERLHAEIEVFAKLLHKIDATPAKELSKG